MSIKVETIIKITSSGSYLYLSPKEYTELTGKNIQVNGSASEAEKDKRITELEAEVKNWQDYVAHSQRHIDERDKEIERLKNESAVISNAKDCRIKHLTEKLKNIRILKSANMDVASIIELDNTAKLLSADTSDLIAELETQGNTTTCHAIEPAEPTPTPEPEPIAEAIPESESSIEPDFNDTAAIAEEVTSGKYPAKKKGRQIKDPFTPEQEERYMKMIQAKVSRKEVMENMVHDAGITSANASNRYYTLKNRVDNERLEEKKRVYNNQSVIVISPEASKVKLAKSVIAELDAMPDYGSIKEFKNACCENTILKSHDISDLKGPYKTNRTNLTW